MPVSKIYFPNLNGIRFIAALMVIIHHISQWKEFLGYSSYAWDNPIIYNIGKLGVDLFFVLSGFLITYLLLQEERQTSTIDIKKFYLRRILRIWPLYFLIIALSLFVIPYFHFFTFPAYPIGAVHNCLGLKVILFSLLLANVEIVFFGFVPYAGQTWSIGTEEQFYLIWPVILSKVKNKYIALGSVIVIYLTIQLIALPLVANYTEHLKNFALYWNLFSIQCMAIGGFCALLLSDGHKKILALLYSKTVQVFVIAAIIIGIGTSYSFPYVNETVYSCLFALIILNLASNPKPLFTLENSFFSYLGKISYGLYMFHPVAITICIKLICTARQPRNYFLYPAAILLTIFFASISYRFFESRFLKIKIKYSTIISGDEALQ